MTRVGREVSRVAGRSPESGGLGRSPRIWGPGAEPQWGLGGKTHRKFLGKSAYFSAQWGWPVHFGQNRLSHNSSLSVYIH